VWKLWKVDVSGNVQYVCIYLCTIYMYSRYIERGIGRKRSSSIEVHIYFYSLCFIGSSSQLGSGWDRRTIEVLLLLLLSVCVCPYKAYGLAREVSAETTEKDSLINREYEELTRWGTEKARLEFWCCDKAERGKFWEIAQRVVVVLSVDLVPKRSEEECRLICKEKS